MIILLANLLENIASLLACVPRTALENVPPPLPLERIIHVFFAPNVGHLEISSSHLIPAVRLAPPDTKDSDLIFNGTRCVFFDRQGAGRG